ncbi:MAG: T9SS type A sorting domain-containing protein [Bacteroidetes bacterium]|nr:T9SS type A sorting domain-containing protein [Bacteroidota bacterium]
MKLKFLSFFFLFSSLLINGQEIKLKSGVVSSAGSSSSELSAVNISKWRIGEVHLIVLQRDKLNDQLATTWDVSSYPNPFNSLLNLSFQTETKNEFTILVIDILGKRQLYNEEKIIMPNQVIQLDLAFLSPALYLVTVIPKDKSIQRIFKVQKN